MAQFLAAAQAALKAVLDPADQIQAAHLQRARAQLEQAASVAQPHGIKPTKPKAFQGQCKVVAVDNFLFHMEQYFTLGTLPADLWVAHAIPFLEGDAATWWRSLRVADPRTITWAAFADQVRATFKPADGDRMARQKMARLRHTGLLSTYVGEFRTTRLQIANMSADDELDAFLRGLRHDLQLQVELAEPATTADAIAKAERLDHVLTRTRDVWDKYVPAQGRQPRPAPVGQTPDTAVPMELDALNPLSERERQALIRSGRCFCCRCVGHMANNCPLNQGHNQGRQSACYNQH